MHKWKLNRPCGFLKLAKKALNPGIWESIFQDRVHPDAEGESSSGDEELNDFLNQQASTPGEPPRKRVRVTTQVQESLEEEPALHCTEAMLPPSDEETDECNDDELLEGLHIYT